MHKHPAVSSVCHQIAQLISVHKIYLFSHKVDPQQRLLRFKLLCICDCADKAQAERTIYNRVDSDIAFDLVLYTPREWADCTSRPFSFAAKVQQEGCVVYGA